jgi:hypothetical protein
LRLLGLPQTIEQEKFWMLFDLVGAAAVILTLALLIRWGVRRYKAN